MVDKLKEMLEGMIKGRKVCGYLSICDFGEKDSLNLKSVYSITSHYKVSHIHFRDEINDEKISRYIKKHGLERSKPKTYSSTGFVADLSGFDIYKTKKIFGGRLEIHKKVASVYGMREVPKFLFKIDIHDLDSAYPLVKEYIDEAERQTRKSPKDYIKLTK